MTPRAPPAVRAPRRRPWARRAVRLNRPSPSGRTAGTEHEAATRRRSWEAGRRQSDDGRSIGTIT
ncbi:hypothetical protein ACFRK5_22710 [Streptomyces niveus]|uniref:hypothetical protein n=1 Tax=Streptomyces niveus TaxID=193462 RepID=UPI003685AB17